MALSVLRFCSKTARSTRISQISRSLSLTNYPKTETEEWGVFTVDKEGNMFSDNWSLVADGVTNTGNAFRNARLPILTTRLSSKVEGGKVEVSKPVYTGSYKVLEAGDEISQDDFAEKLKSTQEYLSSGVDLFIEDAGVGSYSAFREGVRIVSDNAAVALIARTFLIPLPPRPVDHRARFDGWNLSSRYTEDPEIAWNGTSYDKVNSPLKGQRPIIAYVAGPGSDIAVQFIEVNSVIVGANIVAGGDAPVRGVVEAITQASTVVLNEKLKDSLALPSTSLTKGKKTLLVVGGDDSLLASAATSGSLHGAYGNILTTDGVSAYYNAIISAGGKGGSVPSVVSNGLSLLPVLPNNMASPVTDIAFVGSSGAISEGDAVSMLLALTDESKEQTIKALLKGVKLVGVDSSSSALKLL